MKKLFVLLLVLLPFAVKPMSADDIWKSFEEKNRTEIRSMLEQALKDPALKTDACLALIMLNEIEDKGACQDLMKNILDQLDDPSPYLFALWFSDAVTGGYGKKDKQELAFLTSLFSNSRVNGSIRAACRYVIGNHFLSINNIKEAVKQWSQMGAISRWQFTGVFENSNGTGFDKSYPPITQARPDAVFRSKTNAEVKWFSPALIQRDSWISTMNHLAGGQGVAYVQTFVQSPAEIKVILAVGCFGSLKVWLNDQLLFWQEEEKQTELDIFKSKVSLHQGYNRLLIQLGFTSDTEYPNFICRMIDDSGNPLTNLQYTDEYHDYTSDAGKPVPESIEHFAESWFKKKIASDPKNVNNYLLLSKVYYRRGFYNEAIDLLQTIQKIYPKNILVNYYLLLNYLKIKDRTALLNQLEAIRNLDALLPVIVYYDFDESLKKNDLEEAEKNLELIGRISGTLSKDYYEKNIKLLAVKKDFSTLIDVINEAYSSYPNDPDFINYKVILLKNQKQSQGLAIKIMSNYVKSNYNFGMSYDLIEEYENNGLGNKVLEELLRLRKIAPENLDLQYSLINKYYDHQNYGGALAVIKEGLKSYPYNSVLWYDKSFVDNALNKKEDAIIDLQTCISHNPNNFTAREKLRELEGKKPLLGYLKPEDPYGKISTALKTKSSSDNNEEYVFNDYSYVVFNHGASLLYYSLAVKVINKAGIDNWKEVSIPYNSYTQDLIVQKAELLKKGGQKIQLEVNENQIVCPSLEEGDVLYFEYMLKNYTYGRFRDDFWYTNVFDDTAPVKLSRFRLFLPHREPFLTDRLNFTADPDTTYPEDFVCYDWTMTDLPKINIEEYMPVEAEVGKVLSFSSVTDWKEVAGWYSDVSVPVAKDDYNVNEVYHTIFDSVVCKTDYDKAKAIYDWICKNINYSYVSFRQSGYVPQRPMITISTRLGDCKDLSTLFLVLARKAGIPVHLVLVNTRDNGENSLRVPSTEFNHCIVRIDLPDGSFYQELTDSKLPFGIMPLNLINSQALVIPNAVGDTTGGRLIHLPSTGRINSRMWRNMSLNVQGDDLAIVSEFKLYGDMASNIRHAFEGLSPELTSDKVKSVTSGYFQNNTVNLKNFSFEHLDDLTEEVCMKTEYTVTNGVTKIGPMKAVKIPFCEKIFVADAFTKDTRTFPINYYEFENCEYYENIITVILPAGSKVQELPQNLKLRNRFVDYQLTFERKSDVMVVVTRKVKTEIRTFGPEVYQELKETIRKVLSAEDAYISYK